MENKLKKSGPPTKTGWYYGRAKHDDEPQYFSEIPEEYRYKGEPYIDPVVYAWVEFSDSDGVLIYSPETNIELGPTIDDFDWYGPAPEIPAIEE